MRIIKTEYVAVYAHEWDILQKAEAYIEAIRRECSHPDLNTVCEKLVDAFCDVMDFVQVEADE